LIVKKQKKEKKIYKGTNEIQKDVPTLMLKGEN